MLLDAKHGWMVKFCGLAKTWVEKGFGLRDLEFSQIVATDDFWDIRLYHWIRGSKFSKDRCACICMLKKPKPYWTAFDFLNLKKKALRSSECS
jgi:hypothetical protein